MSVLENKEFSGERARMYGTVLQEFPLARADEVQINMKYLKPVAGERILEVGSGSGLYTKVLSDLVGLTGEVAATDPSQDQLTFIDGLNRPNVRTIASGADQLHLSPELSSVNKHFDAVWSLGAFHHCSNKSQAFRNFSRLLKRDGRVLICDVLAGSALADYFDAEVARFSITGHEVAFLTKNFFASLCDLFGFSEPKFHDLDYLWHFKTEEELGLFMYKLHGMGKTTPEHCLEKIRDFMKIEPRQNGYALHVPLTIFETRCL